MTRLRPLPVLLVAGLLALAPAGASRAGCGCDHPPPAWSVVMPPFGSPHKVITIFAEGGSFTVGETYAVSFGSGPTVAAVATLTDRLEVPVPKGAAPGPAAIRVQGPDYDHTYPDSAFTVLGKPRKIKNREGIFAARKYEAAVSADGTLLLPLNLEQVLDPVQFAFALRNLPLAFTADDVVIYNTDGVDLTLFTLDVNSTQLQWGDYTGWTVETDAGIPADIYEGLEHDSDDPSRTSDLFTYWRHEFYTYRNAHLPGGTHEVNEAGYHPDGTLHIDHDHLVIAIRGQLRDPKAPDDPTRLEPLAPGNVTVDVGWVSIWSEQPVDLSFMAPIIGLTDEDWAEELEEVLFGD